MLVKIYIYNYSLTSNIDDIAVDDSKLTEQTKVQTSYG